MNIEIAADFLCGCAEKPVWDPDGQRLFFTDVDRPALYLLKSDSGKAEKVYFGDDIIGGLTLHEDGRLLLFMERGAIRLFAPGAEMTTIRDGIKGEEESRFNDVVADPEGRVFCGTMPVGDRPGRLYRWEPDGSLHLVLEDAGMPNGMDFSPDLRWFYFTDTWARTIRRFAYQIESGKISDGEILVQLGEAEGKPDGLTVDRQGCLWSAHFGGHRVVRYSPDGEEMSRIDLPMAENPTCPVFAGESSTLFLTTAGGGHRPEAGKAAGALLRIQTEVLGKAAFRSRYRGPTS